MAPGTTTTTSKIQAGSWIGPYDEGLNGVNQPANVAFVQMLWVSLGLLAAIMISIQLTLSWARHRRIKILAGPASSESSQEAWARPSFPWIPKMKQHFLYAPLFALRRARSLPLFGTLPTRSQAVFLLFYVASNIAYMFAVNFGNQNTYALLAEIRGRTGTLAVANMVPLVLLIGRHNPVTALMRLKYDDCIMLHRWIGDTLLSRPSRHLNKKKNTRLTRHFPQVASSSSRPFFTVSRGPSFT